MDLWKLLLHDLDFIVNMQDIRTAKKNKRVARKILGAFLCAAFILAGVSCAGTGEIPEPDMDPFYVEKETDRLNEDEIKSLVYHAQKFV